MKLITIGNLSKTRKMPCPSYSLSAFDCEIVDPLCLKYCYARKHHYNFKNVKDALRYNKNKYLNKNWVKDFAFYIERIENLRFFRWFDSGDLPNIIMLEKICKISDLCKNTSFWLPTRRKDLLLAYWEANNCKPLKELHPNLVIRISAKDVNEDPNYAFAELIGVNVSSVTDSQDNYTCSSKDQGGQCLSCRKCWDQNVKEVRYFLH